MTPARRRDTAVACAGLLLLSAATTGCGPRPPAGMIAVTGSITMGGKPLAKGAVHFVPEDRAKTAAARITDGRFRVNLWPAEYRLAVTADSQTAYVDESTGQVVPPVSLVPARFMTAETSGLSAAVDAAHATVAIDLVE